MANYLWLLLSEEKNALRVEPHSTFGEAAGMAKFLLDPRSDPATAIGVFKVDFKAKTIEFVRYRRPSAKVNLAGGKTPIHLARQAFSLFDETDWMCLEAGAEVDPSHLVRLCQIFGLPVPRAASYHPPMLPAQTSEWQSEHIWRFALLAIATTTILVVILVSCVKILR